MRFGLINVGVAGLGACTPPAPPTPAAEIAAEAPRERLATVDAPRANARITSQLVATGTAPANWIFEAVFPARLIGPDSACSPKDVKRSRAEQKTSAGLIQREASLH